MGGTGSGRKGKQTATAKVGAAGPASTRKRKQPDAENDEELDVGGSGGPEKGAKTAKKRAVTLIQHTPSFANAIEKSLEGKGMLTGASAAELSIIMNAFQLGQSKQRLKLEEQKFRTTVRLERATVAISVESCSAMNAGNLAIAAVLQQTLPDNAPVAKLVKSIEAIESGSRERLQGIMEQLKELGGGEEDVEADKAGGEGAGSDENDTSGSEQGSDDEEQE